MLAFFHHLYQDFAQPEAVQWVGNVVSYAAAIPPMTVTIYGGLVLVWRSGIRWSAAPLFTLMGMAGWAIGGFGAVIDSTISLNQLLEGKSRFGPSGRTTRGTERTNPGGSSWTPYLSRSLRRR
jgi:heme/copper-type cytochrome/quinol oxidase subunit 1